MEDDLLWSNQTFGRFLSVNKSVCQLGLEKKPNNLPVQLKSAYGKVVLTSMAVLILDNKNLGYHQRTSNKFK